MEISTEGGISRVCPVLVAVSMPSEIINFPSGRFVTSTTCPECTAIVVGV